MEIVAVGVSGCVLLLVILLAVKLVKRANRKRLQRKADASREESVESGMTADKKTKKG